jgi:ATP-binding cassette subfamily A (ABC1) protein 3
MAHSSFNQFRLLLWKNWVLQKRRKVLTVFQILLPAAFALILMLIRTRVKSTFVADPTVWSSFPADAALPNNLTIPSRLSLYDRRWRLAFTPNVPVVQRLINATAIRMDNATKTVNPITNVGVIIGKGKRPVC